jgi:hypothetical protein
MEHHQINNRIPSLKLLRWMGLDSLPVHAKSEVDVFFVFGLEIPGSNAPLTPRGL